MSEGKKPEIYYIETHESLKGTSMWPQVYTTPMTGTIPVVEKAYFDKAGGALKDATAMLGVVQTLLEFHGKPSKELNNCLSNIKNAESRGEKTLKELGVDCE